MILQSACFSLFCHHRFRQAFDYTPMHQDDQGQLSSRSEIVLKIERGPEWRPSSASPAATTPSTRSRRSVPLEGPVITREREAGYYLSAVEKDSRLYVHAGAAGG